MRSFKDIKTCLRELKEKPSSLKVAKAKSGQNKTFEFEPPHFEYELQGAGKENKRSPSAMISTSIQIVFSHSP
jgi:hypothetical protein